MSLPRHIRTAIWARFKTDEQEGLMPIRKLKPLSLGAVTALAVKMNRGVFTFIRKALPKVIRRCPERC